MNEDLEEIRKRKIEQLQEEAAMEKMMEEDIESQKQAVLRQVLDPAAKERLARIKIARPQIGEQIENQLISLAQSGRMNGKISDEDFRRLLTRILPKKREIKIRRK